VAEEGLKPSSGRIGRERRDRVLGKGDLTIISPESRFKEEEVPRKGAGASSQRKREKSLRREGEVADRSEMKKNVSLRESGCTHKAAEGKI